MLPVVEGEVEGECTQVFEEGTPPREALAHVPVGGAGTFASATRRPLRNPNSFTAAFWPIDRDASSHAQKACRIANRRLSVADRLQACLAIDLLVAWRVMWLSKLGRETPDVSCSVYFKEAEWQVLHCHHHRTPNPPETPPTLGEAMHMVAKLGGFLGRDRNGNLAEAAPPARPRATVRHRPIPSGSFIRPSWPDRRAGLSLCDRQAHVDETGLRVGTALLRLALRAVCGFGRVAKRRRNFARVLSRRKRPIQIAIYPGVGKRVTSRSGKTQSKTA